MKSPQQHFADRVLRTVTGPMWHGPSLSDVLKDVTPEQAVAHAVPDAHSIWEIVLHVTVWADVARARIQGERLGELSPQEDWPPVSASSDSAWRAALEQLHESYRALSETVAALDEEALRTKPKGLGYTLSTLINGAIEHGTYHGGQIALLKRASPQTAGQS